MSHIWVWAVLEILAFKFKKELGDKYRQWIELFVRADLKLKTTRELSFPKSAVLCSWHLQWTIHNLMWDRSVTGCFEKHLRQAFCRCPRVFLTVPNPQKVRPIVGEIIKMMLMAEHGANQQYDCLRYLGFGCLLGPRTGAQNYNLVWLY